MTLNQKIQLVIAAAAVATLLCALSERKSAPPPTINIYNYVNPSPAPPTVQPSAKPPTQSK
jgi:hypothetical protein